MLSKPLTSVPEGDGWLYEPKWDGFRALVFKDGDDVYIQSRELKPIARYFPELVEALKEKLPQSCVLDGEVVIANDGALDFEALLLRIHPAKSRIDLLAKESPSSFVAWDLLALGGNDLRDKPLEERRALLEKTIKTEPPLYLTPITRDVNLAREWFTRFEGAGLDGVISKRADQKYVPGQRVMVKTKHVRTADCVVAGFRWFKGGKGSLVGSLLLGLYDDDNVLHHVGVSASFTKQKRAELLEKLNPYRENARENHPWAEWADWETMDKRMPGATSRWNRGKDLSWEPLRLELVVEVKYDHLQGDRFRHATHFVRWRPDKQPSACRYDQLEVTPPHELSSIFS
jgi:ATP-dependent DNA ligase